MYTLEQITKWGNQYIKELKARGRKFNPIRFTFMRRGVYGSYGWAKCTYSRLGYDTISINPAIVKEEDIRNVILHELAHLDLEENNRGHNHVWNKIARMYGTWYNTKISRTANIELDFGDDPNMKETTIFVTWKPSAFTSLTNVRKQGNKLTFPTVKKYKNFVNRFSKHIDTVKELS